MAYIFQTIADKGAALNITADQTAQSREWFRNSAKEVSSVNTTRLMGDKANMVPSLTVKDLGRMFMFFYDPKHKDTLPYYDTFPLIFPIDFKPKGFLGLNLHYLPTYHRAQLMDALYTTANNDKYDDSTKLKVTYRLLNGVGQFYQFAPCLKMYLWGHVHGQFLNVQPKNWDTALMLPTERFKKASNSTVFKDSIRKIGFR
jgi:hypothetical protein